MKPLFLWRKDSPNIGDAMSGWPLWCHYRDCAWRDLDALEHERRTLDDWPAIVIGGGLLPDAEYYPHAHEQITRNASRCIAAGVGTNSPREAVPDGLTVIWRQGPNPTPCPSCLSTLFDEMPRPTREVVYYENPDIARFAHEPKLRNTSVTFRQALEHLASGETVVTSSYHGAYWAWLLGRRIQLMGYRGKFEAPIWESGWTLDRCRLEALAGRDRIQRFLGEHR